MTKGVEEGSILVEEGALCQVWRGESMIEGQMEGQKYMSTP